MVGAIKPRPVKKGKFEMKKMEMELIAIVRDLYLENRLFIYLDKNNKETYFLIMGMWDGAQTEMNIVHDDVTRNEAYTIARFSERLGGSRILNLDDFFRMIINGLVLEYPMKDEIYAQELFKLEDYARETGYTEFVDCLK